MICWRRGCLQSLTLDCGKLSWCADLPTTATPPLEKVYAVCLWGTHRLVVYGSWRPEDGRGQRENRVYMTTLSLPMPPPPPAESVFMQVPRKPPTSLPSPTTLWPTDREHWIVFPPLPHSLQNGAQMRQLDDGLLLCPVAWPRWSSSAENSKQSQNDYCNVPLLFIETVSSRHTAGSGSHESGGGGAPSRAVDAQQIRNGKWIALAPLKKSRPSGVLVVA